MKVAVCLSGMLRDFEKYFENFKQNILEQADVDLFVHAWNFDRRNLSQENYGKSSSEYVEDMEGGTERSFLNLYKPTKYIFENYTDYFVEQFDKYYELELITNHKEEVANKRATETNPARLMSMLYKIHKCNNLRKEYEKSYGVKYDIVFRFRTEIELDCPISEQDLKDTIAEYPFSISIPLGDYRGGYCDIMSWGNPEAMDIYSSLYLDIDKHIESGCLFHPELLLKFHLQQNEVNVKRPTTRIRLRGKYIN